MHLTCWPFRWSWQCAGMEPSASTDALCLALQLKPLDTAIGQVFAPATASQGPIQTSKKTQSNNKTKTKTYIAQAKEKIQMYCLLYVPRANFAPKIDGHTSSAQEAIIITRRIISIHHR